MASIVPGYEYDIFISYRQKDNKHDGWVTEFVNNLKGELESTFKEEINVYFDINPHDGLLETHDVDASLKEKLRSLIFIPIISQTYCDSRSFAWQYEFTAFNKMAKGDQFGRDIRLTSGNIASRILPVKIHDLDPEDKILMEEELEGVLRGIEFIYKSAGVNRPLRPNEDHPQDNLNKTYYRDQINKVANAVKEIITAIKKYNQQEGKVTKEVFNTKPHESGNLKPKIIITSIIIIALLVPGYLLIPKLLRPAEQIEKSIAVLPFINDSQDTTNVYFINGLMEGIINKLANIKDLRVLSRTSVEHYRNIKTMTISQIASELGVNYIVEGSGQKYSDRVMLSIQLREAESEKQLFSESYEGNLEDVFNIQREIATSVAASIKAVITQEETELIAKKHTSNMDALNMYLKGNDLYEMALTYNNSDLSNKVYDQAMPFFKRAIQLDSTYPDPYVHLGWYIYDRGSGNNDSALYFANRALHFDNKNAKAYALKAWACGNSGLEKDSEEAARLCLQYSPNDGYGYRHMTALFWRREEYAKAVEYFLKAVKFEKDPFWSYMNARGFTPVFYTLGFYEEGLKYSEVVIKYNNDSLYYYRGLLGASMNHRDYYSALNTALKLYGWDNTMTTTTLICNYIYAKDYVGALKQVDEYVKMEEKQGKKVNPSPYLGYVYLKNGQNEKSVYHLQGSIKDQLMEIKKSQPKPKGSEYFYLAGMYSAMDEKGKALESLKEALKYKDSEIISWDTMMDIRKNVYFPPFDLIRDEPEFKEYIKNIEDKIQPELQKIEKLLKEEANHN